MVADINAPDDVKSERRIRSATSVGGELASAVPFFFVDWLAGDVLIAAGTQARWPIREPNGGEFESFWPYLIPGGIKFTEGPTIPGRTGADAASIPISCVGIEIRLTKKRPTGQRAESMALCEDGQFIPRGTVYVHNQ